MFLDYRFAGGVGSYVSGVTQGQYPDGYCGGGGRSHVQPLPSHVYGNDGNNERRTVVRRRRVWNDDDRWWYQQAGAGAATWTPTTHADSLLVNATCWRRYGLGIRKYWVGTIRTEKSNFEKQVVRCQWRIQRGRIPPPPLNQKNKNRFL